MNKQLKIMLVVWCMQGLIALHATSEFRSPLPFDRLYLHYPFESDVENCWALETITAMYGRTADRTFRTDCPKICTPGTVGQVTSIPSFNKTTTNTEPLSALFFGKADFRGGWCDSNLR